MIFPRRRRWRGREKERERGERAANFATNCRQKSLRQACSPTASTDVSGPDLEISRLRLKTQEPSTHTHRKTGDEGCTASQRPTVPKPTLLARLPHGERMDEDEKGVASVGKNSALPGELTIGERRAFASVEKVKELLVPTCMVGVPQPPVTPLVSQAPGSHRGSCGSRTVDNQAFKLESHSPQNQCSNEDHGESATAPTCSRTARHSLGGKHYPHRPQCEVHNA